MSRPFRIWDTEAKKQLAYRYYSTAHAAHNSALIMVRWANVGVTYDIVDMDGAKHLGTYVRRVNHIFYLPPDRSKHYGVDEGKQKENDRNQKAKSGSKRPRQKTNGHKHPARFRSTKATARQKANGSSASAR